LHLKHSTKKGKKKVPAQGGPTEGPQFFGKKKGLVNQKRATRRGSKKKKGYAPNRTIYSKSGGGGGAPLAQV